MRSCCAAIDAMAAIERVVVHIDLDSFYASVEENRNPSLRGKPVGVQQKFLLVTCNWAARARGVKKMSAVAEAKKICPELIVVNGEDLTHYRAASMSIYELVQRFSSKVERLVLDELYVDATEIVTARIQEGRFRSGEWIGHVERDMKTITSSHEDQFSLEDTEQRLMVGTQFAAEIRQAIYDELGYTTCAGVSVNKLCAKIASGIRKPNSQSTLVPGAIIPFISALPVHKLTGIGHHLKTTLKEKFNVEIAADLQRFPQSFLIDQFSERVGGLLYNVCRGIDPSEVIPSGPPKTISDEDSFICCNTLEDAQRRLVGITASLLVRVDDDVLRYKRYPTTLRLGIRQRTKSETPTHGYAAYASRETKSVALSLEAVNAQVAVRLRAQNLVASALMPILKKMVDPQRFHLTLLNVAVTNFSSNTLPTTIGAAFSAVPSPTRTSDWMLKYSGAIDYDVLSQLPQDIQTEILADEATLKHKSQPTTVKLDTMNSGSGPSKRPKVDRVISQQATTNGLLKWLKAAPTEASTSPMFTCDLCGEQLFQWCRTAHRNFHNSED